MMSTAARPHESLFPSISSSNVEGQSHRCFTSNLSLTGLYMEAAARLVRAPQRQGAAGDPLPDGEQEPVWASGEVVYDCFNALFHGTAVRFEAMGDRDRRRLTAFLAGAAAA
jgi:hypothetical protein